VAILKNMSGIKTDAFLSYRIRGFSDSMDAPGTVTDNSQNKCRSFVNNVSVLRCVNCTV